MTEQEARAECARLGREDPECATHEFIARQEPDGGWSAVRVPLPEGVRKTGETGTATRPPPDAPPETPDSDERTRPIWGGG